MKKLLVVGAAGFLGRHLLKAAAGTAAGAEGADRDGRGGLARLDLARPDVRGLRLDDGRFDWAAICAAVTSLERCERDPEGSRERNVVGTLELARRLSESGLKVLFLSSDYVFDGAAGGYPDDAAPHPLNAYGSQKAEVERGLPDATRGRFLVARLSKVFGLERGDGTLLDEMASRLSRGEAVRAATDQVFCPASVSDVARALLALRSADAEGIVNVAGPEACSRFDLARRLAAALGAEPSLVRAIRLADLGEPFRRPTNTSLVCSRLASLVGFSPAPLDASIAEFARLYGAAGRVP